MNKKAKAMNGIELAYIARVIKDGATLTYDKPMQIGNIKVAGVTNDIISGKNYADNKLMIDESLIKSYTLALTFLGMTAEMIAYIKGEKVDESKGVYVSSSDDIAPNFAFGYKINYSDGSFKLVWFLYGTFSNLSELGATTKGDGITYTDITVTYTAVPVDNNNILVKTESDSSIYKEEIGTNWFNEVVTPSDMLTDVVINNVDSAGEVATRSRTIKKTTEA